MKHLDINRLLWWSFPTVAVFLVVGAVFHGISRVIFRIGIHAPARYMIFGLVGYFAIYIAFICFTFNGMFDCLCHNICFKPHLHAAELIEV